MHLVHSRSWERKGGGNSCSRVCVFFETRGYLRCRNPHPQASEFYSVGEKRRELSLAMRKRYLHLQVAFVELVCSLWR